MIIGDNEFLLKFPENFLEKKKKGGNTNWKIFNTSVYHCLNEIGKTFNVKYPTFRDLAQKSSTLENLLREKTKIFFVDTASSDSLKNHYSVPLPT